MLLGLASSFNMRAVDTVWGLQTKVKPKKPHFNVLPQKLNAIVIGFYLKPVREFISLEKSLFIEVCAS